MIPLEFRHISGYITGIKSRQLEKDLWLASPSARRPVRTVVARRARGFVRVEVQAPKKDAGLIRAAGRDAARAGGEKAEALRSTLAKAVMNPEMRTAFDIFGSELPDEIFNGRFLTSRANEVGAGLICEIFCWTRTSFSEIRKARPRPSKRCPLGHSHTGRGHRDERARARRNPPWYRAETAERSRAGRTSRSMVFCKCGPDSGGASCLSTSRFAEAWALLGIPNPLPLIDGPAGGDCQSARPDICDPQCRGHCRDRRAAA